MVKKIGVCYARLLVDNHITDMSPEYMSRYSAEEYVRMVQLAGVESALVYANDHNGNCYFPTKVGHTHANLQSNIFGDAVKLLREKGITPLAYYTVVYNNDCAKRFPQARITDQVGPYHSGRYHFTCPNQPDAERFYCEQLRELLQNPVEGIFIDMTFWPAVCVCDACRKKFGKPLPEMMDWNDPEWVEFQRFREKSLAEFAQRLTDFAKSVRPGLSVVHQFSPLIHGWYLGQSSEFTAASDYASGDFYGNKTQQRLAVKVFDEYTRKPPFEFMTSRCVRLTYHTTSKSDEELYLSALTTLANGGAYLFIDAINPDGTLEKPFYERFGRINRKLAPFREAVEAFKGRIKAETAVYFSMASGVDDRFQGMKFAEFKGERVSNMELRRNDMLYEVLGTAEVLNRLHVPWKAATDRTLDFSGLKVLIVNHATYMSQAECERIRKFVQDGGTLIATGAVSLRDLDGKSTGNFALSDVLGVDHTGKFSDKVTYTGKELIFAEGDVPLVKAQPGTEVRSSLTFTDFPAYDKEHYASIHSNPPSTHASEYPAITFHKFGKGQVLWMAAPLAINRHYTQIEFLKKLYRDFLPEFVVRSENLPESAEITMLKNSKEILLGIVNQQEEFPVIPLCNVKLELRMEQKPEKIIRVSDHAEIPVAWQDGILKLEMPQLPYGEFFRIQ